MADTVYMLGAGINWSLRDFHDLHPPLANDFFEQALCHPTLGQDVYKRKLEPLFRFIRAEFGVSGSELGSAELDLEECFHRIESARVDAGRSGEEERELELWTVGDLLHRYLAEYLSSFKGHIARFPEFKAFGQIILDESATVLTTNYDSLIESAIELASGVRRKVPRSLSMSPSARGVFDEEDYGYIHFNWNRSLAYGAKFDRVQLQRAGGITLVRGDDFYRSADEFPIRPLFLKLHGSIEWFENTGLASGTENWKSSPS